MSRTATITRRYAADVTHPRTAGFADGAAARPSPPPYPEPGSDAPAGPPPALACRVRRSAADFWLRTMFLATERVPWLVRAGQRLFCGVAFACAGQVRRSTLANAARILGPGSSVADRRRLARGVLRSFCLFCLDVGRSTRMTPEQLLGEIGTVTGLEHYRAARAAGRGLIVVTAHMGSFEVGLAALAAQGQPLNVIFRRDAQGGFERQRSGLRARLGVRENPVDDGWTMWIRLRDALAAGEAVVFQGDRVMPGQRGRRVPFLHGHLELPTGPVKLARIGGSPILPVLSARRADGKVDLFIEPPIAPDADAGDDAPPAGVAGRSDPMLHKLAAVLERYVRAFPDQWLMIHPAFCEDQPAADRHAADAHSDVVPPKDVTRG